MKKCLFYVFLLAFICCSATVSAASYSDVPFRGFVWGSDVSKLGPNPIKINEDESQQLVTYQKADEDLKVGTYQLTEVHYKYWQGKLYQIFIYSNNVDELQELARAKYQNPFQTNPFVVDELYYTGSMWTRVKEIKTGGAMIQTSQKIQREFEKWTKEQAKKNSSEF